jgi:protein-S-isoprenylcysteine O-methyltransferase Ste14
VTVIVWLYRNDPALLSERFRRPGSGGQSASDRLWVYAIGLVFLAWIALMPLDARRFRWSPPFSPWLESAGAVLLVGSVIFMFRSFRDNTFLSPLVRVQSERGQRVVTTGVYGIIRHPMYLGAALMFIGGPLLTGSLTALALGVAMTALLVIRIQAEEKLLAAKLEGYTDYKSNVRYRLVPFIW